MKRYPRLISWDYYNGINPFFKKPDKEFIRKIFILSEEGEKEISDRTLCNMEGLINTKYFRIETTEGYTKNSKKYKDIYFKMKQQHPELEGKINHFNGILKDCGSYVFLNLKFLDTPTRHNSFFEKHKNDFLCNNQFYVKKESFSLEFVEEILKFIPFNMFGNEIKEYQEEIIPKFLLQMKVKFPEIHSKLSIQSDKDIRESYLGKEVPITSLKPGKVKPVGLFFLPEIWNYDGEYLTVISTKDKYPIEMRIKADNKVIVKIIDPETVDLDKIGG